MLLTKILGGILPEGVSWSNGDKKQSGRVPSPQQCVHKRGGNKNLASRGSARQNRKLKELTTAAYKNASLTLQETASLDKFIDIMLSTNDAEELGKVVAENLLAFDQNFWIRLASRNDSAPNEHDKKRISDLASTTMHMVEALVKNSDSQIADSSDVLTKILASAADQNGEWHFPLSEESLQAMKKEIEANAWALDESLLANAFAWMRKASEDKLEGMVVLLQQVLQVYAARALVVCGHAKEPEDRVLDDVIDANEMQWLQIIQKETECGKLNQASLAAAIRRKMESIVLGLPSGSYAQRVQAEYLKEIETRAEAYFDRLSADGPRIK